MTQKDTQVGKVYETGSVIASEANVSVNPFGQNRAAEIAYKKAERLVLPTHLVTNFVPKSETVRENIRERAQQLLPKVLEVREGFMSTGSQRVTSIVAHVRYILSLLDVLYAAGYVSAMNVEVLKTAYADFTQFLIASEGSASSEGVALGDEHFVSRTHGDKGQVSQGHFKGHADAIKDTTVTDIQKDTDKVKDTQGAQKRDQSVRTKRRVKSRRMAILDVVTKKSPAHIKDISAEITDCSEKTIQRELASLVEDGVLKKEGSKRWTVYSLAV